MIRDAGVGAVGRATSPEIKSASDRMGLTRMMEEAGAMVLSGVCFYQAYAREIAEAQRQARAWLATTSYQRRAA